MNHLSLTQLNSFLNFSKLYLLIFNHELKLTGLFPRHCSFLGWDESDFNSFRLTDNFLAVNSLDKPGFLGALEETKYSTGNFYWQNSEGSLTGPLQTYFMLVPDKKRFYTLLAFVQLSQTNQQVKIEPFRKSDLFMSELLTGWINMVSDPLESLQERLEILRNKNSRSDKFQELIQLTGRAREFVNHIHAKLELERREQPVSFNLNDLLPRETQFLQSDPFFRSQVKVVWKPCKELPKSRIYYGCLSGIFSEFYHYVRRFVIKEGQYTLQAETFLAEGRQGIHLNYLGDFKIPSDLQLRFPVDLEGDAKRIALQTADGLDTVYLRYCLHKISGSINLTLRKDMMKLRLILP